MLIPTEYKKLTTDLSITVLANGSAPNTSYFVGNVKEPSLNELLENPIITVNYSNDYATITIGTYTESNTIAKLNIKYNPNYETTERNYTISLMNNQGKQSPYNLKVKQNKNEISSTTYENPVIEQFSYPNSPVDNNDTTAKTPSIKVTLKLIISYTAGNSTSTNLDITSSATKTYTVQSGTTYGSISTDGKVSFKNNTNSYDVSMNINLTVTANGKTSSKTATIIQSGRTIQSYGALHATFTYNPSNINASSGVVCNPSISNIYIDVTYSDNTTGKKDLTLAECTVTYSVNDTTMGSVNSTTGIFTSSENKGTTSRNIIITATLKHTNNPSGITLTHTITLAAPGIEVTYRNLKVISFTYPDASIIGGTLTPTVTYSQEKVTTQGSNTSTVTISTGATITYSKNSTDWDTSMRDVSLTTTNGQVKLPNLMHKEDSRYVVVKATVTLNNETATATRSIEQSGDISAVSYGQVRINSFNYNAVNSSYLGNCVPNVSILLIMNTTWKSDLSTNTYNVSLPTSATIYKTDSSIGSITNANTGVFVFNSSNLGTNPRYADVSLFVTGYGGYAVNSSTRIAQMGGNRVITYEAPVIKTFVYNDHADYAANSSIKPELTYTLKWSDNNSLSGELSYTMGVNDTNAVYTFNIVSPTGATTWSSVNNKGVVTFINNTYRNTNGYRSNISVDISINGKSTDTSSRAWAYQLSDVKLADRVTYKDVSITNFTYSLAHPDRGISNPTIAYKWVATTTTPWQSGATDDSSAVEYNATGATIKYTASTSTGYSVNSSTGNVQWEYNATTNTLSTLVTATISKDGYSATRNANAQQDYWEDGYMYNINNINFVYNPSIIVSNNNDEYCIPTLFWTIDRWKVTHAGTTMPKVTYYCDLNNTLDAYSVNITGTLNGKQLTTANVDDFREDGYIKFFSWVSNDPSTRIYNMTATVKYQDRLNTIIEASQNTSIKQTPLAFGKAIYNTPVITKFKYSDEGAHWNGGTDTPTLEWYLTWYYENVPGTLYTINSTDTDATSAKITYARTGGSPGSLGAGNGINTTTGIVTFDETTNISTTDMIYWDIRANVSINGKSSTADASAHLQAIIGENPVIRAWTYYNGSKLYPQNSSILRTAGTYNSSIGYSYTVRITKPSGVTTNVSAYVTSSAVYALQNNPSYASIPNRYNGILNVSENTLQVNRKIAIDASVQVRYGSAYSNTSTYTLILPGLGDIIYKDPEIITFEYAYNGADYRGEVEDKPTLNWRQQYYYSTDPTTLYEISTADKANASILYSYTYVTGHDAGDYVDRTTGVAYYDGVRTGSLSQFDVSVKITSHSKETSANSSTVQLALVTSNYRITNIVYKNGTTTYNNNGTIPYTANTYNPTISYTCSQYIQRRHDTSSLADYSGSGSYGNYALSTGSAYATISSRNYGTLNVSANTGTSSRSLAINVSIYSSDTSIFRLTQRGNTAVNHYVYADPSITAFSYPNIPCNGGTVTPTISRRVTRYAHNSSCNVISTTTLTTGGTITYSGITGINASTGAVSNTGTVKATLTYTNTNGHANVSTIRNVSVIKDPHTPVAKYANMNIKTCGWYSTVPASGGTTTLSALPTYEYVVNNTCSKCGTICSSTISTTDASVEYKLTSGLSYATVNASTGAVTFTTENTSTTLRTATVYYTVTKGDAKQADERIATQAGATPKTYRPVFLKYVADTYGTPVPTFMIKQ